MRRSCRQCTTAVVVSRKVPSASPSSPRHFLHRCCLDPCAPQRASSHAVVNLPSFPSRSLCPPEGIVRFRSAAAAAPAESWRTMRSVGAGLWLRDRKGAREWADRIARAAYASSRDPGKAALFFVALGRARVLAGLYRTAGNDRLAEFMSRDFGREEARVAAEKNAFVVRSRHEHEMSAALFLLAGSARDAAEVAWRDMDDPQLAVFLARVLGDDALEAELLVRMAREAPDGSARAAASAATGRVAESGDGVEGEGELRGGERQGRRVGEMEVAALRHWRVRMLTAGSDGVAPGEAVRLGAGLCGVAEVAVRCGRIGAGAACLGAGMAALEAIKGTDDAGWEGRGALERTGGRAEEDGRRRVALENEGWTAAARALSDAALAEALGAWEGGNLGELASRALDEVLGGDR